MKKVNSSNQVNEDKKKGADENLTAALNDMGIKNPSQIIRYTLREEGNKDVLKVYYKRAKGSLLPSSRKYKFGRSTSTHISDSGKPEYDKTFDISPVLLDAVKELDTIVTRSEDKADRKKEILEEVARMEKSFNSRIKDLRSQLESL